MKHIPIRSFLACLASMVIFSSGCSGAPNPETQGAMPGVQLREPFLTTPSTTKQNLLYVSDPGIGAVVVYAYLPAKIAFVGLLEGTSYAAGECVDAAQNVWVAAHGVLLEYAHGGTNPVALLSTPLGSATDCSIDPLTGNLAAVSSFGNGGAVAIFKKAGGTPKVFVDRNIHQSYTCAYDGTGNLFVDGYSSTETFILAELPRGARHFRTIQLNQAFSGPGDMQWDGKYLVIDDPREAVMYQFSIAGSTGSEVGSTPLNGSGYVSRFFVEKGRAIVPFQGNQGGVVNLYRYPGGGFRTRTIRNFSAPVAAVVSLGSSRGP